MIELITGQPRAGKSYLAVKTLLDEYFTFNKDTGDYEKQTDKQGITLISNIEGLRLPHLSLDEVVSKSNLPVAKFFTKTYQEKIAKKYPEIVYAIDECQQYFPDTFKDIDTRFYFEWHGHLGHQVYLISQDRFRCCRAIVSLAEFETRAVKRTLSLMGELKYNIISDGEIIDRKVLKPKKQIYDLYKSQFKMEHKKPKRVFLKYILTPCILCAVAFYCLYRMMVPETAVAKTAEKVMPKQNNPKNQVQATPQSQYQPPAFVWFPLAGTITINGKVVKVIDPITNQLIDPSELSFPIRYTGRQAKAYLPLSLVMDGTTSPAGVSGSPLAGESRKARAAARMDGG